MEPSLPNFNMILQQNTVLTILQRIFLFFGFRFSHEIPGARPVLNYFIISVNLVCSFAVCCWSTHMFYEIGLSSGKVEIDHICFVMSYAVLQYSCLYVYLHSCINCRKIHKFVFDLARLLLSYKPEEILMTRAKKWLIIMVSATVVHTLWNTMITIIGTIARVNQMNSTGYSGFKNEILQIIIQVMVCLWVIINQSFRLFYVYFIVFVCKMLCLFYDHLISSETQNEIQVTLAERQIRHHKVSTLVRQADDIFAPFMLLSLIIQTGYLIMACRTAKFIILPTETTVMILELGQIGWHLFMFILDAVCCSQLNEKASK